jgi:biopolymer transport protein ExbD
MAMSVGPAQGGEETPMSDINTTPLVDVMLVLLIIFLITVPVVIQAIPLKLPKVAYEVTLTKPENVSLSVKAGPKGECEVYWNLQRVTAKQLQDRGVDKLEQLIKNVGGAQNVTEENMPEVHIRGDRATPFRCIGGVMNTMQAVGFQRIGFISEPDPTGNTRRL